MGKLSYILIITILISISREDNPNKKYMECFPFDIPELEPPTFPDYTFKVFDTKGDGKFLCTEAFAKAIENSSSKEGGKLLIPAGIWLI